MGRAEHIQSSLGPSLVSVTAAMSADGAGAGAEAGAQVAAEEPMTQVRSGCNGTLPLFPPPPGTPPENQGSASCTCWGEGSF